MCMNVILVRWEPTKISWHSLALCGIERTIWPGASAMAFSRRIRSIRSVAWVHRHFLEVLTVSTWYIPWSRPWYFMDHDGVYVLPWALSSSIVRRWRCDGLCLALWHKITQIEGILNFHKLGITPMLFRCFVFHYDKLTNMRAIKEKKTSVEGILSLYTLYTVATAAVWI